MDEDILEKRALTVSPLSNFSSGAFLGILRVFGGGGHFVHREILMIMIRNWTQ